MRIAFRARSWVWVGFGNHALPGSRPGSALGLHVLHFSYRSLAQYSRKADVGIAALEVCRTRLVDRHALAPWAGLSDDERADRWAAYLRGEAGDMTDAFVRADRSVIADPTGWRTGTPSTCSGTRPGRRSARAPGPTPAPLRLRIAVDVRVAVEAETGGLDRLGIGRRLRLGHPRTAVPRSP